MNDVCCGPGPDRAVYKLCSSGQTSTGLYDLCAALVGYLQLAIKISTDVYGARVSGGKSLVSVLG